MNNRHSIHLKISRELYVKSGNRCAKCQTALCTDTGSWIGEIAHIEAVNQGGARYNPMLIAEQVNAFDNLILLCCNCHTAIDSKDSKYTVSALKELKNNSERTVSNSLEQKSFTDYDRKFALKIKQELMSIVNIVKYLDIHGGFHVSIIEDIDIVSMSFEEDYYSLSDGLIEAIGSIYKNLDELQGIIMINTQPNPITPTLGYAINHILEGTEETVLYLRTRLVNDIHAFLSNKELYG